MSRPQLALDFVPLRPRGRAIGNALLAIGVAGALWMFADYRSTVTQRAGLALRMNAARPVHPATAIMREDSAVLNESAAIAVQLNAPWSQLLFELEIASRDQHKDVAVLAIESDREKHSVRLIAESRSLPAALAYLQRLQSSRVLRYPTLDSHEIRNDDPERPVRFQITAEWRQDT